MLAYDADLELFRDNFKRFMNEHVAPYYDQWEREGLMPRSVWNALGENGFLCVDVPEEYGGYGVPTDYSLQHRISCISVPKNRKNTGYQKW